MPLSISSSNSQATLRRGLSAGTWLLFVLLFLLLGGAEFTSGFVFNRISHMQRRLIDELAAARRLRPSPPGQPVSVLLTGNSLLLFGLDVPLLQEKLRGQAQPTTLIAMASFYYDYYYALNRLFHQGMRPQYIVLSIGSNHITSNDIRGEYSAYYWLDQKDILDYVAKTRATPTETSTLLFSHFSSFYAGRKEMRNYLITRMIPGFFEMIKLLTYRSGYVPGDPELERIVEARFRALNQLSHQYGAQFVYVIMPCRQTGEDAMVEAGRRVGVPVLLPIRNFALSDDYYSDGFHLNGKGATVFTAALAESFRKLIASETSGPNAMQTGSSSASPAPQEVARTAQPLTRKRTR
jgi:lysophospholipase L1-like esterase